MPTAYTEPGALAARAKSNLATFGTGATPSQIAANALVKTIQRESGSSPIVLTASYQVVALGVETIAGGQKIILTGTVTAQVTAVQAGTLLIELTVDNVLVGAVIAQSFESDATNVSASFCFEVTPTPGTRAFAIQAKHDDLSSLTIPAHGATLVEMIVTV